MEARRRAEHHVHAVRLASPYHDATHSRVGSAVLRVGPGRLLDPGRYRRNRLRRSSTLLVMPDGTNIDFGLDGIGHQLADRLLAVPIYQRSYSWEDDQIQDYCNDLRSAFASDQGEYFLGTVVLSQEGSEGRDTIIDGQQRMATTSMLIASIRDHFRNNGEQQRGDTAHSTYIGAHDMDEDEFVPRLFLNQEDDEFYRKFVVDGDRSAKPDRPSQHLIKQAVDRLDKFVAEIVTNAGTSWPTALVKWLKFIGDRVRIIYVAVPTESDAFMIFETLNDRGADLTLADLLKNYLFGLSDNKLTSVRDHWVISLAAFDQSTETFITFLRHYWSSHNGAVRERDLYKSIKQGVANKTQAVKFSEDMEKASRLYAALLNGEHDFWNDYGTSAKDNIDTLNRLGLEQSRPLLMAVLQHFTKTQQKKVLRAAVSWSVRGLIVGGIGGGTTEKAYCNAAVKVRSGSVKTAKDLLGELTAIVPSDAVFEDAFVTARVTKAGIARYYLVALQRTAQGEEQPELVPNANEEEVNLEHVLPKRAKAADWPQFTDEERAAFLHRVGNLALLKKDHNGAIGSQPFSAKQPILKASSLTLTREVGDEADWTPQKVKERQKRMAKLAVTTWGREP